MRRYLGLTLVSLVLIVAGCNRAGTSGRSDAQIASDVQNKINADNNLPDKQVTINANNGVVTLSGNVSSDAARNAAASDAAQVEGVKTVVNNLELASATTASNTQPQQEAPEPAVSNPEPPRHQTSRAATRKTSPSHRNSSSSSDNGDNGLRTTVPQTSTSSVSSNNASSGYDSTPSTPPPPAAPQKVTVPAGTQVSIRMNDEVDSEKAQVGDVFHGSISAPVSVDGQTAIPTTADVEGRVVEVKSAGRFAGQSVLTLELTSLKMNGKSYSIQSDRWTKSGSGRGKSTAAKVGGGAALGAVLGGIFGGGKGAAIGAAAGAGAGTGVSAATKGQQILLKPETVLTFNLQSPVTVTPGTSRQAMNQ
jgi:hypothetical protein